MRENLIQPLIWALPDRMHQSFAMCESAGADLRADGARLKLERSVNTNALMRRSAACQSQTFWEQSVIEGSSAMQIHSIGIDLGKTTFHLVALGAAGNVLVKKKFTQTQLF
jgi:hypothetical protein